LDKIFYITTAIYYVNDVPHIGNASEAIAADVVARYERARGRKVIFGTGTDENAIKVAEAAASSGISPQQYVDSMVPVWSDTWRAMHIQCDDWVRTTEPRHRRVVEAAFSRMLESGDIYKDLYKYRNMARFFESHPEFFALYPELLNEAAREMLAVDGTTKRAKQRSIFWDAMRKRKPWTMARDFFGAWRSIA
jgi:cysteinyl-tRNA synthetase